MSPPGAEFGELKSIEDIRKGLKQVLADVFEKPRKPGEEKKFNPVYESAKFTALSNALMAKEPTAEAKALELEIQQGTEQFFKKGIDGRLADAEELSNKGYPDEAKLAGDTADHYLESYRNMLDPAVHTKKGEKDQLLQSYESALKKFEEARKGTDKFLKKNRPDSVSKRIDIELKKLEDVRPAKAPDQIQQCQKWIDDLRNNYGYPDKQYQTIKRGVEADPQGVEQSKNWEETRQRLERTEKAIKAQKDLDQLRDKLGFGAETGPRTGGIAAEVKKAIEAGDSDLMTKIRDRLQEKRGRLDAVKPENQAALSEEIDTAVREFEEASDLTDRITSELNKIEEGKEMSIDDKLKKIDEIKKMWNLMLPLTNDRRQARNKLLWKVERVEENLRRELLRI